jgi:predicted aspartyl protease
MASSTGRRAAIGLAGALACVPALSAQSSLGEAERWYHARQWFELRTAVTVRSPALLRAAVAAAFNDRPQAERLLRGVVRSDASSDVVNDAYALLSQIYLRSGEYARFVRNYDEWAAACPTSQALVEEKDGVDKFRGRPDQVSEPRRASVFHHEADDFSVPVSINGYRDDFLFDTGAWQSIVTEAEAKKLGLAPGAETHVLTGASGQTATFRTAVAKEVIVGAMRFRDVSFGVIAPPEGLPRDLEGGIVGMPILLALGRIRWSTDGAGEVAGATRSRSRTPNLVFDRHRLLVAADVLGRRVLTTLDTGARSTDLNANFAAAFRDVVDRDGRKGTASITGAGGTRTFESVELPQVAFTIGRATVWLRPASVTLQRIGILGGECCVGNAGHDLLVQTRAFSIDFSTMTLQLE